MVWIKLPEVPVMVTVARPRAAVLEAVSVSVLVVVALAGLKDAVTPAGRPVATRLTEPVKLLRAVTVIVLLPEVPWATLTGEADSE